MGSIEIIGHDKKASKIPCLIDKKIQQQAEALSRILQSRPEPSTPGSTPRTPTHYCSNLPSSRPSVERCNAARTFSPRSTLSLNDTGRKISQSCSIKNLKKLPTRSISSEPLTNRRKVYQGKQETNKKESYKKCNGSGPSTSTHQIPCSEVSVESGFTQELISPIEVTRNASSHNFAKLLEETLREEGVPHLNCEVFNPSVEVEIKAESKPEEGGLDGEGGCLEDTPIIECNLEHLKICLNENMIENGQEVASPSTSRKVLQATGGEKKLPSKIAKRIISNYDNRKAETPKSGRRTSERAGMKEVLAQMVTELPESWVDIAIKIALSRNEIVAFLAEKNLVAEADRFTAETSMIRQDIEHTKIFTREKIMAITNYLGEIFAQNAETDKLKHAQKAQNVKMIAINSQLKAAEAALKSCKTKADQEKAEMENKRQKLQADFANIKRNLNKQLREKTISLQKALADLAQCKKENLDMSIQIRAENEEKVPNQEAFKHLGSSTQRHLKGNETNRKLKFQMLQNKIIILKCRHQLVYKGTKGELDRLLIDPDREVRPFTTRP